MILRPKSQEEMMRQLHGLKPTQRKAVVFFGRHPRERTGRIAASLHKEWEVAGAVAIQVPRSMTPEKFAQNIAKARRVGPRKANEIELPPSDSELSEAVHSRFEIPVIHLHRTFNTKRAARLQMFVARNSGVDSEFMATLGITHKTAKLTRDTTNRYAIHPAEILVEHNYNATPLPPSKATLNNPETWLSTATLQQTAALDPRKSRRFDQVHPAYLEPLPKPPELTPKLRASLNALVLYAATNPADFKVKK